MADFHIAAAPGVLDPNEQEARLAQVLLSLTAQVQPGTVNPNVKQAVFSRLTVRDGRLDLGLLAFGLLGGDGGRLR